MCDKQLSPWEAHYNRKTRRWRFHPYNVRISKSPFLIIRFLFPCKLVKRPWLRWTVGIELPPRKCLWTKSMVRDFPLLLSKATDRLARRCPSCRGSRRHGAVPSTCSENMSGQWGEISMSVKAEIVSLFQRGVSQAAAALARVYFADFYVFKDNVRTL